MINSYHRNLPYNFQVDGHPHIMLKLPAQEDYNAISINGFVTDSTVRKVAKVSGSKGVLRSPFQWLYDIMNSDNKIEIKRVMASDGRRFIVIDRVTGEE